MPLTKSKKSVLKNTLVLYVRQMFILFAGFYTARRVLNILGVEDYGIYHLIAGITAMFGSLGTAMSGASQRYFMFELGRHDFEQLRNVFSLNIEIYLAIDIVVLLVAETIGLWFLKNKLIIPPEKINSVLFVYQITVVSLLFSIMQIPYMAIVIAHEDMNIYASISILEAGLKLVSIFLLNLVNVEKLRMYSIFYGCVVIIISIAYIIISKIKYCECKAVFYWNGSLFKEMIQFSGFNFLGSCCFIFKSQGASILINQFFNPAVVAARSFGEAINSAVYGFLNNFNISLCPRIIKNYSSGKNNDMLSMVFYGAKGSFFLMFLFTLPVVLEAPMILSLWLKILPEYIVPFTRLAMLDVLITSPYISLQDMILATGKNRGISLSIGLTRIALFFLTFIALYSGAPPYSVGIIACFMSFIGNFITLFISRKLVTYSIRKFHKEVIFPLILVSIASLSAPVLIHLFSPESLFRSFAVIVISFISVCIWMYLIGLNKAEKEIIRRIFIGKLKKILSK
jgi:O-antigen/teichoic acid export membrane protein